MERKIIFTEGEYYHLFNRGVDKRKIFSNNKDKERFLKLLFVSNSIKPFVFRDIKGLSFKEIERKETLVEIGCYCLMDNHFHILIREKEKNGISIFMKKLSTSYSMYFNKKSQRTGNLFEDNFKANHANKDEYLKYLFSYIHLNPVKLIEPKWKEKKISSIPKAKSFLKEYKYSSYKDYIGEKREESLILDRKNFPEYFESTSEFKEIIDSWLNLKNESFT